MADPVDSAYDAMLKMLSDWGLGSLAGAVLKFIQDGYSQDQVSVLVQDTPEYKTRFAGNEKRKAAGMAVLSPRDYLSVEAAYKQILGSNGMPVGFYDQPSDFADWIGNDVAPQEVSTRVSLAVDAADKMDANTQATFRDWYGVGKNDLAAFFLDQNRALPHIQKLAKSAALGGAYSRDGLTTSQSRAEELAGWVGTQDPANLVAQVADATRAGDRLSNIYGGQDYRQAQAEAEIFQADASSRRIRENLTAQETAAFSGKSGVGQTTLSKAKNY